MCGCVCCDGVCCDAVCCDAVCCDAVCCDAVCVALVMVLCFGFACCPCAQVGCEVPIVKAGAAGGLVMMALFRSDSTITKELCLCALFNLLCDPTSRMSLMKEEVRVGCCVCDVCV